MSYVYIESETSRETGNYPLYTVGFYDPSGRWQPESDHGGETGKVDASERVARLNGHAYLRDQVIATRAVCACSACDRFLASLLSAGSVYRAKWRVMHG